MRSALADSYDVGESEPDIQVVDVDLLGDRELVLRHATRKGVGLAEAGQEATLRHIRRLWGYAVRLEETPAAPTALRSARNRAGFLRGDVSQKDLPVPSVLGPEDAGASSFMTRPVRKDGQGGRSGPLGSPDLTKLTQ